MNPDHPGRWVGEDELPIWLHPLHAALGDPQRMAGLAGARTLPEQPRRAAVLVVFDAQDGEPQLLFIERANSLRNHPGQVAFPGGRYEPGDDDLVTTALREASEETGIEPSGVTVFGALPPVGVPVSGFDVCAVLGWWRHPHQLVAGDPNEVATVEQVSIAALSEPENRVRVRHPSGNRGPGFLVSGLLIWGMTAHLVDTVLDLGGWHRPWDRTRIISAPEDYRLDQQRGSRNTRIGDPDD